MIASCTGAFFLSIVYGMKGRKERKSVKEHQPLDVDVYSSTIDTVPRFCLAPVLCRSSCSSRSPSHWKKEKISERVSTIGRRCLLTDCGYGPALLTRPCSLPVIMFVKIGFTLEEGFRIFFFPGIIDFPSTLFFICWG